MNVEEYKKLILKKPKRRKYGNKKVVFDGIKFDSRWEFEYYQLLVLKKKVHKIIDFKVHVTYPIKVEGTHICNMNIDFVVVELDESKTYIDTKSKYTITPTFKLKAKLFKAIYGSEVQVKLKNYNAKK